MLLQLAQFGMPEVAGIGRRRGIALDHARAIEKHAERHTDADLGQAPEEFVRVRMTGASDGAQIVCISEISGVQINRLLVLATRLENLRSSPQSAIRELIEAEFARLARAGLFSLSSTTSA